MIVRGDLIISLMVFMLVPVAAPAAEVLSQQDIYSEFRAANEAFSQANSLSGDPEQAEKLYSRAVLHYEKIIDLGGIKNAKLYYNLANAYLLRENLGMAILNYLRAERLDSADADNQKNLAFARSRRIDNVPVKTGRKVLQTLFFWHYDLSGRARVFLSCVFFGLLCLILTVLLWVGRRAGLVPACVFLAILLICFSASVTVEAVSGARQLCGVIVAPSVVARQGDGQNYPPSFKEPLHTGTEFELLEQRPGWLHIQLTDGSSGWILDNGAELI